MRCRSGEARVDRTDVTGRRAELRATQAAPALPHVIPHGAEDDFMTLKVEDRYACARPPFAARLPDDRYERVNIYTGMPFTVAEICDAVTGKAEALAAD